MSDAEKHKSPPVVPVGYSISDAAEAIGVSQRSIYNLVEAGKLRLTKIGRRSIIPAKDLHALVEGEAA